MELMQELNFTVREMKTAKKCVSSLDFIEISKHGVPAKTFYLLKVDLYKIALQAALDRKKDELEALQSSTSVSSHQYVSQRPFRRSVSSHTDGG